MAEEKNNPQWYCFLLDGKHLKGVSDLEYFLTEEMKRVFKKDFYGIKLIGERTTEDDFGLNTESYFFVCCNNYQKNIEAIRRCKIISLVLPNIDNPEIVSLESIKKFEKSACIINTDDEIEIDICDIVKVRDGYLKDLSGIVIRLVDHNYCDVFFRLYTRLFEERLMRKNLIVQNTVFNYIKFPVIDKSSNKIKISDKIKLLCQEV